MLMMEITEINEDVTDAVGELVNIIGGAAKAQLEELEMIDHAMKVRPELVTQVGNQRMVYPGRRAAVVDIRT